jgi:hypothetical protein
MKEEREKDQTESIAGDELSRRRMMKLTAAGMTAALAEKIAAASEVTQWRAPVFFTRAEFAMVDELTEIIIPADDHSPGARAAEVAAYIDKRMSESLEEDTKQMWRSGLKLIDAISRQMHGRSFMQSSPEQKVALLKRISKNEMNPQTEEEKFFRELKRRTARAYYTSKIGIHNEMEYKGNTSLKEFAGYDAT